MVLDKIGPSASDKALVSLSRVHVEEDDETVPAAAASDEMSVVSTCASGVKASFRNSSRGVEVSFREESKQTGGALMRPTLPGVVSASVVNIAKQKQEWDPNQRSGTHKNTHTR